MKYSKQAFEKWLTSLDKKIVNRACHHLNAKLNCDVNDQLAIKVYEAQYNECILILLEFNPFVDWDKLIKFVYDNGYAPLGE